MRESQNGKGSKRPAKPFKVRAELRLKNARLIALREELGMGSGEFAHFVGISPSVYSGYETMRIYPSKAHAKLLAELAACAVDELFPPELARIAKEGKNRVFVRECDMTPERLLAMTDAVAGYLTSGSTRSAEQMIDLRRIAEHVDGLFQDLTSQEQKALTLRFGLDGGEERTLVEAGDEMGVCRQRVRQIQVMALGKLRKKARRAAARDEGFSYPLDDL